MRDDGNGGGGRPGPMLRLWVALRVAWMRLAGWARSLAGDGTELERRLIAVAAPVAVMLCQGAIVLVTESILLVFGAAHGTPVADTVRAIPGMLRAWSIPLGCAGVILPMVLRGVRTIVRDNGGLGWVAHPSSPAGAAAGVGLGVGAGVLMWLLSVAASLSLRSFGVPIPAMSRSTADALAGPAPLLVAAFAAPVAEEVLFRGVVSRSLLLSRLLGGGDGVRTRHAYIVMLLVAGLPFGIMHMDGSAGFPWLAASVLWMTVFGAVQSLLADRVGLGAAIGSHVSYNCIVLAAVTLF